MELRMPRMSLKWKIFAACLDLSLAILAFNFIYWNRLARRSVKPGEVEMASALQRYQAFQVAMSHGLAAAVDVWASSERLQAVFAAGDDVAARPLLADVEQRLSRTLHPDLIVLIDRHGDATVSSGSPIALDEVRTMRLFADLRQGMAVPSTVLVEKDHAYLVSAAPVSQGDHVVGALAIGVRLDRLFTEFKAESDSDPKTQVELALISGDRTLAASVHADDWDALAHAVRPEARRTVDEGAGPESVVTLPDGLHDFAERAISGYSGGFAGPLGSLYAFRNRASRLARVKGMLADNFVVGVVALLIAGFVSFCLSVLITRPINQFIEATREIAHGEGDLTRRLEVSSRATEMETLAENLNAIFGSLHQLATEVQGASFQVGASSAEISAASKQMLGGASDQAAKIESSTVAVTELSSSIQQVAENAMEATQVAKQSGDHLQVGIDKLGDTKILIEKTAERISALGQSGKRIGNIVEVIRQISEQTSLLALNASIEAAHAGEQGRGFAVVADEVSSLARRVGQSAKDIEALIGSITEQTAEAVTSMQAVTAAFGEHVGGAADMQRALKQIVDVIGDTARSVTEQAVVSDEIARNMDAVQKIAHEVLASSEEAVVQGDQLHALALKLEQLVRGFRIDRDGDGAAPNGNGAHAERTLGAAAAPALPPKSAADRRKVARS